MHILLKCTLHGVLSSVRFYFKIFIILIFVELDKEIEDLEDNERNIESKGTSVKLKMMLICTVPGVIQK